MLIRRLHPDIRTTRTLTGRLATSGFPVLGLPKRTEEGRRIRGLVRAPDGYQIYSADYSQIELRSAAEQSQDPSMLEAFRNGFDIHQQSVDKIFKGREGDAIAQRTAAKEANFGYWMGMSEKGLTEQVHKKGILEWSRNCPGCKSFKADHLPTCDSLLFFQQYDVEYPGAKRFRLDRRSHAEKTGFAYGLWGMEWYLPGVWSPHEEIREGSLRQTHALPISEGAQRLLKKAMKRINDELTTRPEWTDVEVLLQIHDELLFAVPTDLVHPFHAFVTDVMEHVVSWSIPIVAEGSAGDSWAACALKTSKIQMAP